MPYLNSIGKKVKRGVTLLSNQLMVFGLKNENNAIKETLMVYDRLLKSSQYTV